MPRLTKPLNAYCNNAGQSCRLSAGTAIEILEEVGSAYMPRNYIRSLRTNKIYNALWSDIQKATK